LNVNTTPWTVIARHEWRLLWRDATGWIVVAILTAAFGYGLSNGARWVRFERQTIERELTRENADWTDWREETRRIETGQAPDSPFSARNAAAMGLFYGRMAVLPPGPFASTSIGQSDVYPYFYKVRGERRDAFLNSQEMENPVNLLNGRFDVSFALIYLMPLVILALAFDLLSGERDGGTLPSLMAQSVTPRTLMLGKVVARGSLVAATVSVVIAGGLFAVSESPDWRWLLWWSVGCIYGAFWFSIAALVNARGWTSMTNAVALSATWVLLVVLIPAVIHLTASVLAPVPSRAEMIEATRLIETDVRDQAPALLENYYRQQPAIRPASYDPERYDFPVWWTAIQGEVDRRMTPVLSRIDAARDRQQTLVRRLSVLSPALLVQEICNDLAGTGWARQRRFEQQVTAFHRAHRAFYEPKAYGNIKLVSADYDRMPRFSYVEESGWTVAVRAIRGLVMLAGPALLIALLTGRLYRSF
jgi:ABC-2 type transport system permease protein